MYGKIKIVMDKVYINNIALQDKTNLIHINQFVYKYLDIQLRNFNLTNSTVNDGTSFIYLLHSA